jgi:hypothetical protein
MYIEIDLAVVPPTAVLRDPDDFKSFKVVVRPAEHSRVSVESLEQLAGDRAGDAEWRRGLEQMVQYAEQHGWVDERGVRAHIEWPAADPA